MNLTDKEEELIQAIRNYRRAYPNGEKNLEIYIMDLVYELMEMNEQSPSPKGEGY